MTPDDYKLWEKNIFYAIKNVSNIEMQKLAWLGKSPKIVSSFSEVYNVLYDDFDFEDYIKYYESKHSSDNLLMQMKRLDIMMSNYNPPDSASWVDDLILLDPKWIEITKQAKIVYDNRPAVPDL
ncbi:MAG: hypothetical protein JSS96_15090 [Bacteroidetes bacterium]|nr:hypothetical protein [Bacteroidota bacterium]